MQFGKGSQFNFPGRSNKHAYRINPRSLNPRLHQECSVECGFECREEPSICQAVCGDGEELS